MEWKPITKTAVAAPVEPNLQDYEQARAAFSWQDVEEALDFLPEGRGLNLAHEAVDRHANGPRGEHTAIRWLDKDGTAHDYSYAELKVLSNRFANMLRNFNVGKGDRVFVSVRPYSRTVYRRPGHLEEWQRFLPALFRLWPGTNLPAHEPR